MATNAAEIWTALGDATRRGIFESLAKRPRSVGELAEEFPVSRPAVSQHLKVLKNAGLVVDVAVGNRRVYQVNPPGLERLRTQLDSFWNQTLETYDRTLKTGRGGERNR